jgi:hypothetical protein
MEVEWLGVRKRPRLPLNMSSQHTPVYTDRLCDVCASVRVDPTAAAHRAWCRTTRRLYPVTGATHCPLCHLIMWAYSGTRDHTTVFGGVTQCFDYDADDSRPSGHVRLILGFGDNNGIAKRLRSAYTLFSVDDNHSSARYIQDLEFHPARIQNCDICLRRTKTSVLVGG